MENKKSPKTYRYVRQLLPMPSVRTLQTVLQNINMDTGVYPCVMSHVPLANTLLL